MANSLLVTNEQAVNRATLLQTTLVASKLRLLQNYTPAYTDPHSVLVANEATFTGYPAGGYTIANWTGPALPGTGGASITSPAITVAPSAPNTIANDISGFWVETAAGLSTGTYLTGTITPFVHVLTPTDQFPIVVQDYEGVAVTPQ